MQPDFAVRKRKLQEETKCRDILLLIFVFGLRSLLLHLHILEAIGSSWNGEQTNAAQAGPDGSRISQQPPQAFSSISLFSYQVWSTNLATLSFLFGHHATGRTRSS